MSIIVNDFFKYYELWPDEKPRQDPKYVKATREGHELWQAGKVAPVLGGQANRNTFRVTAVNSAGITSDYPVQLGDHPRCGCGTFQQTGKYCRHLWAARYGKRNGDPKEWEGEHDRCAPCEEKDLPTRLPIATGLDNTAASQAAKSSKRPKLKKGRHRPRHQKMSDIAFAKLVDRFSAGNEEEVDKKGLAKVESFFSTLLEESTEEAKLQLVAPVPNATEKNAIQPLVPSPDATTAVTRTTHVEPHPQPPTTAVPQTANIEPHPQSPSEFLPATREFLHHNCEQ